MPLTQTALTFSIAFLGAIISASIMYASISRMLYPLGAVVAAGIGVPIILMAPYSFFVPFVTLMDYPQSVYLIPTGPPVAIMVGCWAGLVLGYYAGLQKDEHDDASCYRCLLSLLGLALVGLLMFIMIP